MAGDGDVLDVLKSKGADDEHWPEKTTNIW